MVKNPTANAGDVSDSGSIPGLGRSAGGGHGNPLQYSCLENPMDRKAWWATVQRVRHDRSDLAHSTHSPFQAQYTPLISVGNFHLICRFLPEFYLFYFTLNVLLYGNEHVCMLSLQLAERWDYQN